MADEREKKRKKTAATGEPAPAPARDMQDMKAGEMLRHARMDKSLELEEVSSAIHVRVAQLRAIEEGHIESLPGMTYALGFVKSYASYLKLDPAAVAAKFRAEHSVVTPKPDLKFPEPVAESKMPDPIMIGAAVFGAIAVLGIWFMFFGGEEKTATNVASAIPAPPSPSEIAPLTATPPPASVQAPAPAVPSNTAAAASETPAAPANTTAPAPASTTAAATASATPAAPSPSTATPPTAAATAPAAKSIETEAAAAPASLMMPRQKPTAEQRMAAQQQQTMTAQNPPQTEVINIHQGRGRVLLVANQASWIQVTDSSGYVILKKVLRPGDRYYVPDEPGLSLVTSNAGGLDVIVDGRPAGTVGKAGEIMRGVPLNPDKLRPQRTHNMVHD